MKKFIIFCTFLFCTAAIAHTINWYVDGSLYHTTTCNSGDSVTPPTPPTKYGYTFREWEGYTQLEYIETTGTQYIDTGIYPNGLIRMTAKIETLRAGTEISAFSGVIHSGFTGVWQVVYSYQGGVDFNVSQQEIVFSQSYVGIQDFDIDQINKTIICNGITKYMTETPVAVEPGHSNIPLGRYQYEIGPGPSNFWYGKIYFTKLYDNNILVRDMIPVLDKNGTPCMYDKVSNTFFYNAGTGDFIAGPAVSE